MNDKVLITGGCGFVGTNLIPLLVEGGFSRLAVVDKTGRWPLGMPGGTEFFEMDILSFDFAETVAKIKPSTVIHLAAIADIPYCNEHPSEAWNVHVRGTQAVIDATITCGAERFFHASTMAVYCNSPTLHLETDKLEPADVYGQCKVENERQIRVAASRSHCKFAVGRIFNVVGAYERNPHLIPDILKRLRTSRRIEVGNMESKRDYIHVRDVSRGIIRMLSGINNPIDFCNIGTGEARSVVDVIHVLSEILGEKIECVSSVRHRRLVDRPFVAADNSKLRNNYGWKPEESFKQALRDAMEHPCT